MQKFLRFLNDSGFQIGVGKDEGIHRTIMNKMKFALTNMIQKSHIWLRFPINNIAEAQQGWNAKYQFPCASGAIDCTHIRIPKPFGHGDGYHNKKVDSRILKNSAIYVQMNNNNMRHNGMVLLGDTGCGTSRWSMTSYRNPETREVIAFNTLFTKERVIIKRCFGQLKVSNFAIYC
nr:unnamed protein product [Callosobruchus analis]